MAEDIGFTSHRLPKVLLGAVACSIMGLALFSSVGCSFSGSAGSEGTALKESSMGALQRVAGEQNDEKPIGLSQPDAANEGMVFEAEEEAEVPIPQNSDEQGGPSDERTLVETPYYTLEVPEDSLENGWTTSFDDSLIGDDASGIGGHRLEVYTPSSGNDPYFTVLQYTGEWFGLQHDQGYATTSEAFSIEVDGVIWKTAVMGGPYGDYGPMTLDESLAFTQYWAQHVLPPA